MVASATFVPRDVLEAATNPPLPSAIDAARSNACDSPRRGIRTRMSAVFTTFCWKGGTALAAGGGGAAPGCACAGAPAADAPGAGAAAPPPDVTTPPAATRPLCTGARRAGCGTGFPRSTPVDAVADAVVAALFACDLGWACAIATIAPATTRAATRPTATRRGECSAADRTRRPASATCCLNRSTAHLLVVVSL